MLMVHLLTPTLRLSRGPFDLLSRYRCYPETRGTSHSNSPEFAIVNGPRATTSRFIETPLEDAPPDIDVSGDPISPSLRADYAASCHVIYIHQFLKGMVKKRGVRQDPRYFLEVADARFSGHDRSVKGE